MKHVITSLVCVLLLAACKHPSQTQHQFATAMQPPKIQHLSASELRQKVVGTWLLDSWSKNGTPETITVVFGADGTFESSQNFTDPHPPSPQAKTYRATWQAEYGGFTVTQSNSLPCCNLQVFQIERLDDHEMVCWHQSAIPPDRFR